MATIPCQVKRLREKTPAAARRSAAGAEAVSPAAALVRHHDRDRYQTALFAPAARREALFALYAFNYEIARVREAVSQPVLGRIRLEWWRENIDAIYAGGPVRRHPVVEALAVTIRERELTRAYFDRLIEAREADCNEAPPATLAALEDYAEGTSSQLLYLALEALGVRDAAAVEAGCHVGIAYALSGLLRAMPYLTAIGRPIVPLDIAARNGLDPEDVAVRSGSPAVRAAIAEIAAAAWHPLRTARAMRAAVPRPALPALLPAAVAENFLRRLARAGYDPFAPALAQPDPLQSWRLAVAALRRRF
jgi:NADH dehydrogenase [ubiquinone] 1 alpha subcomplex assembly factor 6